MTDEKMYNDCCSESDELSSCESTMEAEAGGCTGKGRRHTPAQLATLNVYFQVWYGWRGEKLFGIDH